jgi:hypothetical protein
MKREDLSSVRCAYHLGAGGGRGSIFPNGRFGDAEEEGWGSLAILSAGTTVAVSATCFIGRTSTAVSERAASSRLRASVKQSPRLFMKSITAISSEKQRIARICHA